jgi:hypothetical protein
MLCGAKGTTHEMAAAGSPVLGHHMDLGMAVKWFCPDPCFETYRNSPRLQARVHQWQDDCAKWAKACVRECAEETLREMESLPEGLQITPSERARCAVLRDKLEDVAELQSDEDNLILNRVCRNINRNTFHHPKTGTRKDYDSLVKDLRKLERLTPEERGRLK